MIMVIIAIWLGFLWVLVATGILSRWHMWMKLSPIVIFLAVNMMVILPMGWTAPGGPVKVMAQSVPIAASVSGRVTEVPVEGGLPLKSGDILFRLDPTLYQAEVDKINARLSLAKLRLQQKSKLLEKAVGAAVDVQEAQASLDELKAQLTAASWNLEHTVVTAPADGFVSNVVLSPGTQINAGQAVMPFIDTSAQIIGVQIMQSNLRNIRDGQSAEVIFPILPGRTFPAKVVNIVRANASGQVLPSGLAMPVVSTASEPFWVELELEAAEPDLLPDAPVELLSEGFVEGMCTQRCTGILGDP